MYELRKYHGDRVMSLTYDDDRHSFSVGIISPGEYEFGAIRKEIFRVTYGSIGVWVEGMVSWKTFSLDQEFEVEANRNFKLKVKEISSYICFYE